MTTWYAVTGGVPSRLTYEEEPTNLLKAAAEREEEREKPIYQIMNGSAKKEDEINFRDFFIRNKYCAATDLRT